MIIIWKEILKSANQNKTKTKVGKTKQCPRLANNKKDKDIDKKKYISTISKTKQCLRSENKAHKKQRQRKSAKQNDVEDQQNQTPKNDWKNHQSPTLLQHWILGTCTPCNTPSPPAKYIIRYNNDDYLEITKYIRYMIMIYNSCM